MMSPRTIHVENPAAENTRAERRRITIRQPERTMSELTIPVINVAALFGGPSPVRDRTDAAIMEAASTFGFFAAGALPADVPIDRESRSQLLRIFQLPAAKVRPLWRQKFDASQTNVYRGWFPLQ